MVSDYLHDWQKKYALLHLTDDASFIAPTLLAQCNPFIPGKIVSILGLFCVSRLYIRTPRLTVPFFPPAVPAVRPARSGGEMLRARALLPAAHGENKKGILSLICGVENSIFDEVFAFSHPF